MNCFKSVICAWVFLCLLTVAPVDVSATDSGTETEIADFIRRTIENALDRDVFVCRNEVLCGAALIPAFYERRHFKPAWIEDKTLSPRAKMFMSTLDATADEGLRPADYHINELNRLIAAHSKADHSNPGSLAQLDLLLTDAFLMYAAHMIGGRVNPETVHAEWVLPSTKKEWDIDGILDSFLATADPLSLLASLPPPHGGYFLLRKALKRYKNLAVRGGWNPIPPGPTLRKGDKGPRIALLQSRLEATGDMGGADEDLDKFGEEIELAVKKFQVRHGLEVDGIAGRKTLGAMNVPAEARVNQIRLNLERWRWFPREMESPHISVNIADYSLDVVEDESPVISMKAVVGRDYRRTPVFSDRIRYLVFNPYWTVPNTIAVKDILPKVKKDPAYLERERIRVFKGWDEDSPELDPGAVDWASLGTGNFRYRLRQDPGPNNALGRVKFMFPNKFNVYLHDTNDAAIFKKTDRSLSSGCIRVEKPIELAVFLLKNQSGWTPELVEEIISEGKTKTVVLTTPVAVHIQYRTAWMDETMRVHFRKDIYNRDSILAEALEKRPLRPESLSHWK